MAAISADRIAMVYMEFAGKHLSRFMRGNSDFTA
jgi:hypothetical protein